MSTRQETVGNPLGDECPTLPAREYPHAVTAPLHGGQSDRSDEVRVGYNRTEVGMIPSDWDVLRIGDLFESTAGGDFDPHRSSDVQSDSHPYPIYANGLSQEGLYGFSDYTENRTGSITITARGTLGIAIYRDTSFVAVGRLLVLKPKIRMDARYFSNYINHGVRFAVESTGVPQLTAPQVARYLVPVPPESEQRAIAEALSEVDELLTELEFLIAKKRAIKQAAMQQLLTGKTRLPGFSGAWETKSFDDVFRRLNGKGCQIKTSEYSSYGLHPVIDQGQDQVVAFSDRTEKLFVCPSDGVIVFGDHTCIVKYIEEDFLIGADGVQLLAMRGMGVTKFFFYQLLTKDIPSTGYNRHFKFLRDLNFEIPTLSEQKDIAIVLSDMDGEIATLEQQREKTQVVKKSMMQLLLTGRARLLTCPT